MSFPYSLPALSGASFERSIRMKRILGVAMLVAASAFAVSIDAVERGSVVAAQSRGNLVKQLP